MMLGPAAYTVAAVRAAEERAAGQPLMQRAAAGLARVLADELRERAGGLYGRTVVAAVGGGNNGGDGLFALARLARRGVGVRYWLTSQTAHEAGLAALVAAGGRRVDATGALGLLADADLVLDAVYGIGGRPGLPPDVATFAAACHDLDVPVVAVDLPSGLDADAAQPTGDSFRAATTVTFGAKKLCCVLEPARSRCGRVVVVPIGLEFDAPAVREFTLPELVAHLPVPGPTSDKYSRGVVGLDTGSPAFIGAGVLSATGAVYAGAGMVRCCGGKPGPVRLALPNVVVGDGRVQAWVLGSGWGERPDAADRIRAVLEDEVPTALDADTLHPELLPATLRPDVVLTPHAGELARLLGRDRGAVTADPLAAIRAAVERWNCTVLLKGSTQYVAAPGFDTTVAIPGPGWTAQAGSGDVLAGILGTMLAAGLHPPLAALSAASLQALAADRALGTWPPQDVARRLPDVIAELAAL